MRRNEEKKRIKEKEDGAGAGRKKGAEVGAENEQSAAAAEGSVGGAARGGVEAEIDGGAEVESGGRGGVDRQVLHLGLKRYPLYVFVWIIFLSLGKALF